jgi:hypothetical protein
MPRERGWSTSEYTWISTTKETANTCGVSVADRVLILSDLMISRGSRGLGPLHVPSFDRLRTGFSKEVFGMRDGPLRASADLSRVGRPRITFRQQTGIDFTSEDFELCVRVGRFFWKWPSARFTPPPILKECFACREKQPRRGALPA